MEKNKSPHVWLFILKFLNRNHNRNRNLFGRIMIKIMSKHTAGTKYTLTDERRYLRFSARVNEAANDFLRIQMTNFLNPAFGRDSPQRNRLSISRGKL